MPSSCTVVASELLNPRGISFGSDGTLYIAEAGLGGEEPDFPTEPSSSPGASPDASTAASPDSSAAASPDASPASSPEPVATHGDTGRVTAVTADGTQAILVDGLTSYNFGPEVVGPADVAVAEDGTVYVSIGGPGPGVALFTAAGNANSVVSVDSAGTVTNLANIGEYEVANNPDPHALDSNVGGMAMGTDGLLYIADSGGNSLYSLDPASGALALVTVFPGLPSPGDTPNPARGDLPEVDPVPTDVTADPAGGVFVGYLTGGMLWAVPGSAKVVHVADDSAVTDALTGLGMVTGVAEFWRHDLRERILDRLRGHAAGAR